MINLTTKEECFNFFFKDIIIKYKDFDDRVWFYYNNNSFKYIQNINLDDLDCDKLVFWIYTDKYSNSYYMTIYNNDFLKKINLKKPTCLELATPFSENKWYIKNAKEMINIIPNNICFNKLDRVLHPALHDLFKEQFK